MLGQDENRLIKRQFPIDDYPSITRRRKRRFIRLRYFLLLILILVPLFFFSGHNSVKKISSGPIPPKKTEPARENACVFTKKDLVRIDQNTIKNHNLTIDWDLQQFIAEIAAKYKLYYGSIVVINAQTGDVLALYGQNTSGQDCSLGLETDLAASIFKLVTVTAAMDQRGFTSRSMFYYSGNAHTLYKKQLTSKRNKWCMDISLADAFARSNNIVFAKLGTMYLGVAPIDLTAKKMGFWKSPLQEFESAPSTIFIPKDDYDLAELACGFNKQTRISPLHAAQMVTAVLNGGCMVTPKLVRNQNANVMKIQVMKKETAQDLSAMMERTVRAGTVAKSFRRISSDRVLKYLDIGAKSGSIDGDQPKGKRNWFVGYAKNRNTGEGIAIGCLLVLESHFRIEADMFSRLVIRHYFLKR
jgi:cell division protein FtsI/penicillin-binding protein 2